MVAKILRSTSFLMTRLDLDAELFGKLLDGDAFTDGDLAIDRQAAPLPGASADGTSRRACLPCRACDPCRRWDAAWPDGGAAVRSAAEEPAQSGPSGEVGCRCGRRPRICGAPGRRSARADHRAWDPVRDEAGRGKSAARDAGWLGRGRAADEAGPERAADRGGSAECEPAIRIRRNNRARGGLSGHRRPRTLRLLRTTWRGGPPIGCPAAGEDPTGSWGRATAAAAPGSRRRPGSAGQRWSSLTSFSRRPTSGSRMATAAAVRDDLPRLGEKRHIAARDARQAGRAGCCGCGSRDRLAGLRLRWSRLAERRRTGLGAACVRSLRTGSRRRPEAGGGAAARGSGACCCAVGGATGPMRAAGAGATAATA